MEYTSTFTQTFDEIVGKRINILRMLKGHSQLSMSIVNKSDQATIVTIERGRILTNPYKNNNVPKSLSVSSMFLTYGGKSFSGFFRIKTALWMPQIPSGPYPLKKWLSAFSYVKTLCEENELELKTYLKLKDGMAFLLGTGVLIICRDDLASHIKTFLPGEGKFIKSLSVTDINSESLTLIYNLLAESNDRSEILESLKLQLNEYQNRDNKSFDIRVQKNKDLGCQHFNWTNHTTYTEN